MKRKFGITLACLATACTPSSNSEKAIAPVKTALGFDLSSIDSSARPCQDFFQYTSGGWIANNPIPESEARWGKFGVLRKRNYQKLKVILDSVARLNNLPKGSYAQLVSDFYKSGMDSSAIEEAGSEALKEHFTVVQAIQADNYPQFMSFAYQNELTMPLRLSVSIDDRNSNRYLLHVSQSGIGLPDRDYYLLEDSLSRSIQKAYRKYIVKILSLNGMELRNARLAADGIYQFEKALAQNMMSREERRQPENTYNKKSLSYLQEQLPHLKLASLLSENEMEIDSVIVQQPAYLRAVDSLLPLTDAATLRNYHRFHLLRQNAAYLPHSFVQAHFDFYGTTLEGKNEMKPRWERIMDGVSNGLGEQLGHLFVDKHFSETSKKEVEQMVEDLRSAFEGRIKQLSWMTDSTKKRAQEKLDAFSYKIGYPDTWKDYSDMEILPQGYLQNALNRRHYLVDKNKEKLHQPVNKEEWWMPPYWVNAYYSSSFNEVVFPAGILQPPFYDPQANPAINYGAIGGVIGHEFSHGFDDQGSKYDAKGNLNNWWTDEDRQNFDALTQQLAEQYSSYEAAPGAYVNGEFTLGENIADLGGLTLAYHAYDYALQRENREPISISGFDWKQRIFLGWAQVWTTNQREAYTRKQVKTDPHSPARFRVNGTITNIPAFREAWNCRGETPLTPPDSNLIVIW